MPNLVALAETVWASVGGPKNFGDAERRPLRTGACLTHRNTLLPTCATLANVVALGQTVGA